MSKLSDEALPASPTGIWSIAETPEDREEVFRFRYERYFAETRHLPGVDHKSKRVFLPHDAASTHILVRSDTGETLAVGTATRASNRDIVPIWREVFQFERLQELDLDRIVIISRLVVVPSLRQSAFVGHFFVYLLRHCIRHGYRYAVHYCTPDMLPLYERLGYHAYGQPLNLPAEHDPSVSGPLRIPLLLAPFDTEHLRRVRSLFRDVPQGPPEDLERLHRILPECAVLPLCAQTTAQRQATLDGLAAPGVRLFSEGCIHLKRGALLPLRAGQLLCAGTEPEGLVLLLSGEALVFRPSETAKPCVALPGALIRTGVGVEVRMTGSGTLVAFHNLLLPQSVPDVCTDNIWNTLRHHR